MPTYDQEDRFRHEYHRLRREEQRLFNQAVAEFVASLKEHRPPPKRLGIERYERQSGVYEFHWSDNML
jgi:hypothetical protein